MLHRLVEVRRLINTFIILFFSYLFSLFISETVLRLTFLDSPVCAMRFTRAIIANIDIIRTRTILGITLWSYICVDSGN